MLERHLARRTQSRAVDPADRLKENELSVDVTS
jgi:hypothetical protein